jgi:serine/threonine-protein kinase
MRKIGAGGEGLVYDAVGPNAQQMAFKEYSTETLRDRGEATRKKLLAMIANPPRDPSNDPNHQTFVWPKALVLVGNSLSGFCMPLLTGPWRSGIDIVDARERNENGVKDWHWGLRAGICCNLARAVDALHDNNVVWGDLHERNFVINRHGFVTLLDLDTAAIRVPDGTNYPASGAAQPEWCALEISSATGPTREGDLWALAVQIYIMLMEGVRPFAAAGYHTDSFRENIERGLFPIVDSTIRLPVWSPFSPPSPPLDVLPPDLQRLFRRCFGPGRTNPAARPAAREFVTVLGQLRGNLKICNTDSTHVWAPPRSTCPWCERLATAHAAAAAYKETKTMPTGLPAQTTATTKIQPAQVTTPATTTGRPTQSHAVPMTPRRPTGHPSTTVSATSQPPTAVGVSTARTSGAPRSQTVAKGSHRRVAGIVVVAALLIAACIAAAVTITHNRQTVRALTPSEQLSHWQTQDKNEIENKLRGSWVPQLASSDSAERMVQEQLHLRKKYNALLLKSDDYVYVNGGYWVSIAPMAYPSAEGALEWCQESGRGSSDCYAKLITHDSTVTVTAKH